jgi:hypothetical protein
LLTALPGFEVGRVTSDIGMWMSTLLDHDMATFDGTVVDCPPSLTGEYSRPSRLTIC